MNNRHKTLLILAQTAAAAALIISGTACSNAGKMADPLSKRNAPDSIAARINGETVTWEQVDRRARGFLKDEKEMNHFAYAPDKELEVLNFYRKRAIRVEVMRHLLLNDAKRMRVVITDEDRQRAMDRLQPLMARRNWTTNDFFTRSPIGEAQTRLEFEESVYNEKLIDVVTRKVTETQEGMDAEIKRQHELRAQRLEKIETIRDALLKGADFGRLAARESQDPTSAKRGGSLGEVPRGTFGAKIDEIIFKLQPGEISEVVESPDGFHVFKVTSHNAARTATATTPAIPETVAVSHIVIRHRNLKYPEIRLVVINNERRKYADEYYRKLVSEATIETIFPDLAFDTLNLAH